MKQKEQKCWNRKEMNDRISLLAPVSVLNDKLEFMGKQLHIQTENTGFPANLIVTHVFYNGRVILSRKADHSSAAGDSAHIRELMNAQHLQVIQEIKDKQSRSRNTH